MQDCSTHDSKNNNSSVISVYVLKCEQGKYYVGKTARTVSARVAEHQCNQGSEWTKKYHVIELVETKNNADQFDEDKYTKKYMLLYGIDNVRGAAYTQINMEKSTKDHIAREILSANDMCFKCCTQGHLASRCSSDNWQCLHCRNVNEIGKIVCIKCNNNHPATKSDEKNKTSQQPATTYRSAATLITCYRCGRVGHISTNCYANTYIQDPSDNESNNEEDESDDDSSEAEQMIICYRCGREGHKSPQCYAQRHINGQVLK
jgi:hypothetical protein